MGIVCCKQDHSQEHSVLSHYRSKPTAGGLLCEEIKTQFQLCPTKKRQKIIQRRRFRKRCMRKERPIISSPKLLNPKYLTGEKWHNVILTIPDAKMKTRTPVPPPRKKRRSLVNLCSKRNESVEYINLCSCQNESHCDEFIFDPNNLPDSKIHSSETELFKKFNDTCVPEKQEHSNLRKCVSYEDVASLRVFCHAIKTSDNTNVLHSYINRCLFCYINDIMSRLEQLNRTNNDEYKFKLDDTSTYLNDEYNKKETQLYEAEEREEEEQDRRTILDKEAKLSEINEQKLLESLENFCIHCYLNKIQTHPEEREDISSTSRKVEENNLKSSQTGDNNNFSLANTNPGDKKNPLGYTYDKQHFETNFTGQAIVERKERERPCTDSVRIKSFIQPQNNRLDKKYECLFCCINKKKTKQKHYNNGSLQHEIYSKKQKYNVFQSDNTNEEESKYTIGNKVGDKIENKIRNEKLCEINNAQNKSKHTYSNNMLEHFKNLNSCRRRHLNLFKFMCFQCFYVYVQILYVLQGSALLIDDFTTSLFKMRKCEMLRNLSMQDMCSIVNMVQQIHYCYYNNYNESNICKSCSQVLLRNDEEKTNEHGEEINLSKETGKNVNHISSLITSRNLTSKDVQCNFTDKNSEIISNSIQVHVQNYKREMITENNNSRKKYNNILDDSTEISVLENSVNRLYDRKANTRQGFIMSKKKIANLESMAQSLSKNKTGDVKKTGFEENNQILNIKKDSIDPDDINTGNVNNTTRKIIQNFKNVNDPSAAERRKNKFQKLMADLHSKKIQNQEIPRTESHLTDCHDHGSKQLSRHGNQEILDNNGNYLETNEKIEHKSSESSRGTQNDYLQEIPKVHCINNLDLTDLVLTQVNENANTKCFSRRNSIKRKSYRLKYTPESNLPNDLLQIPADFESRRSSVTDSLYELEASLYDMLQNSCSLSMDDVEYV